MTLDAGAIEAVQSLLGEAVVVFAVLTQLGDVWFYSAVLGTWYWLGHRMPLLGEGLDRPLAARAIGITVGAMALTVTLKGLFALERPPGAGTAVAVDAVPPLFRAAYAEAATADGYGFPSGHALGTTAVWGGIAWLYRGGERWRRLSVAAAIVAVVGFSRVALGVHYAASVGGGVAVGLAYLLVAIRVGTTARTFGLALALAVGGAVATGFGDDAAVVLGVALGCLVTWLVAGEAVPERPTGREAYLTALLGPIAVGGPFAAAILWSPPVPLATALGALAGAAALSLPLLVARGIERIGVRSPA